MDSWKAYYHAMVLVLVTVYISQIVSSEAPLHLKSKEFRIPGQYIVVLKDDVDVSSFTSAFEMSVLRGASEGKIGHRYQHAIKGFSAQLSENTLKKLLDSEHVKYIEEDGIVHTMAISSWGLGRVDQRNLPLDSSTPSFIGDGSNTHVYIIDTGTLYSHTEFSGRTGDGVDKHTAAPLAVGSDCDGHGTHCGGTAAGKTYGIATQATVHSVRVLGCDGRGPGSDVIAGMDWVKVNAKSPAVASMSLGGGYSLTENTALQNMVNAGIVVSVAAGNDATHACQQSPGSAPAAITVGATDNTDARADFSNYGRCVDIFAPGVGIKSSFIDSNDATEFYSGTSMACPHVSGAAAALRGVYTSLSPAQVTEYLLRGSTENKVTDSRVSANRLLYIGKETCMARCGAPQDPSYPCQCNSGCSDCCTDYGNLCGNAPSCNSRCGTQDSTYPCQCDDACSSRIDCCSDYEPVCLAPYMGPCDVTVNQAGVGVVSSPDYPNYYDNSIFCYTLITAGAGQVVHLSFTTFSVENGGSTCDYDSLTAYDGNNDGNTQIGIYCDDYAPTVIESSGRNLFLAFRSDYSATQAGYTADVTFTQASVKNMKEPGQSIPEIKQKPEPTVRTPEIKQKPEPTVRIPEPK